MMGFLETKTPMDFIKAESNCEATGIKVWSKILHQELLH
jgi:hypothetical protein